jgi:hypothetical protein
MDLHVVIVTAIVIVVMISMPFDIDDLFLGKKKKKKRLAKSEFHESPHCPPDRFPSLYLSRSLSFSLSVATDYTAMKLPQLMALCAERGT